MEKVTIFWLRGEVEVGLAALYDRSDPVPLQMLLLKEKEETELEKLRTPRSDSGDNEELLPSLLHNSPSPSEVDIFMNINSRFSEECL